MTDLRLLLEAAAPAPTRPLDVDALLDHAARRRPWKRGMVWLASLAVAGALGGGAVGVLAPTGAPSQVETLPGRATTTTTPTPADGASASADAGDVGEGSTDVAAARAEGGPAVSVVPPIADRRAPDEPPTATSCELRSGGAGVSQDGMGGVGFDDPNTHTCTFRAEHAGGYDAAGTWSIAIDRDGTSIERSHVTGSPTCAAIGFIQPGDVVTVSVRSPGGATTSETYINAGPEASCAHRSP